MISFSVGRPSRLKKPPGMRPAGVGVLPVVDRQRQEVALDAGPCVHAGGGEHDRVAVADGAGAVGLLGQVARSR